MDEGFPKVRAVQLGQLDAALPRAVRILDLPPLDALNTLPR